MLKRLSVLIFTLLIVFNLNTASIFAQGPTQDPKDPFCPNKAGINTGLGCIPFADNASGTNAGKATVIAILGWGVGIAGGAGLLITVYASFLIMTSQGDVKKVQAGRELLTAGLSGIVFIVLSVVILNFLGLNILGLGPLGFSV